MKALPFVLVLLMGPAAMPLRAQAFEFRVRHHHVLRDCRGTLRISPDGIEYATSNKGHARTWKYADIQVVQVESRAQLAVRTYEDQALLLGKDRMFEFTLLEGKVPAELSAFLLDRGARPVEVAVLPEYGKPVFELRAKHLHTFGGAMGALRVYPDRVVFQSDKEGESRVWRLRDIQRFGQPDRFRFQITGWVPKTGGPTEVYNFQLLEDLPEGLYDYLWVRLNPSSYAPTGAVDSLR
jgi:hypothetical protein